MASMRAGTPRGSGRGRERALAPEGGRRPPDRPAGPARGGAHAAEAPHEVSSGGGGSPPGSTVPAVAIVPARQTGQRRRERPVRAS